MSERETAPNTLATVVVPARNAAATIGECLRALQEQSVADGSYEVIVVDDASTDETGRLVAEAGVCVIRLQEQRGPAAARNVGIQAAKGDLVCFTDADCIPTHEWLERLADALTSRDAVGCKGIYATRQTSRVARFVQIEYEDKYDRLRGQEHIDFVDTYSAAYRRDVLLANGGFDEIFPRPSVEDQELSFRLAARGYKMVFQPEAVVYHRHAATLPGYFRKKFVIGYWKAQLVRRFPQRGVNDSHTPQVMKVQMGLMALALMAVVAAALTVWGRMALALVLLVFVVTTLPFLSKAWRKDPLVALLSPFLLAVRALALGLGYTWGLIRPQPGFSGTESTIGGLNYLGKRALDIGGAILGLALAAVIGPLIVLAIKLESPGPIICRQERVGQDGEQILIYRFRVARLNEEQEMGSPVTREAEQGRTRVGHFLLRWRLDRLPQFWNVLTGTMSLVGPQAEKAHVVDAYGDWHRRRLSIKPGLIFPVQPEELGEQSLDERVSLELDYIENYSLWKDLKIVAESIGDVLKGQGTG